MPSDDTWLKEVVRDANLEDFDGDVEDDDDCSIDDLSSDDDDDDDDDNVEVKRKQNASREDEINGVVDPSTETWNSDNTKNTTTLEEALETNVLPPKQMTVTTTHHNDADTVNRSSAESDVEIALETPKHQIRQNDDGDLGSNMSSPSGSFFPDFALLSSLQTPEQQVRQLFLIAMRFRFLDTTTTAAPAPAPANFYILVLFLEY